MFHETATLSHIVVAVKNEIKTELQVTRCGLQQSQTNVTLSNIVTATHFRIWIGEIATVRRGQRLTMAESACSVYS